MVGVPAVRIFMYVFEKSLRFMRQEVTLPPYILIIEGSDKNA